MSNATELVKADHERIRSLLASFDNAQDDKKEQIIAQTLAEVAIHGALEQELIVPALRDALRDELLAEWAARDYRDLAQMMEEVSAIHSRSDRVEKFKSFAESVQRHLAEEQEKLLSKLQATQLPELGEQLAARRRELERVRLFL